MVLVLVETQGLEPWTPALQRRCSSQLSYVPSSACDDNFAELPMKQVPRHYWQSYQVASSQFCESSHKIGLAVYVEI